MNPQKKHDVFISYSRKDSAIAEKICKAFDQVDVTYFIDREKIGGTANYFLKIADGIDNSKIMLLLASANSYKSDYVSIEIHYAFDQRVVVLPYALDDTFPPEDFKILLIRANWHNFNNDPIVPKLLTSIAELLGKEEELVSKIEELTKKIKDLELQDNNASKKSETTQSTTLEEIATQELLLNDHVRESLPETTVQTNEVSQSFEQVSVNGVSFNMVRVQGGTFTMDGPLKRGSDEIPTHSVTLPDYWIGETVVTQELWHAVMGNNPSKYKGTKNPVELVNWWDCLEFIYRLNLLTGKQFHLPTEAEWEYAARGGNVSCGYKYAGSNNLDDVAWYDDNSGGQTHPVKQKFPNELGIYDMNGNVWEWCECWHGFYSSNAKINLEGDSQGTYRLLRGGGWHSNMHFCRLSLRYYGTPTYRNSGIGLRLAL